MQEILFHEIGVVSCQDGRQLLFSLSPHYVLIDIRTMLIYDFGIRNYRRTSLRVLNEVRTISNCELCKNQATNKSDTILESQSLIITSQCAHSDYSRISCYRRNWVGELISVASSSRVLGSGGAGAACGAPAAHTEPASHTDGMRAPARALAPRASRPRLLLLPLLALIAAAAATTTRHLSLENQVTISIIPLLKNQNYPKSFCWR